MFYKLLFSLLFLCCCIVGAVEVTVSSEGFGEFPYAREQALTNALRSAVRKGAGVDVISQSKVTNMMLKEDVVFSRSLGYIESYEILERSYDSVKQVYTVKIKAKVSAKPLSDKDELAVQLLLKRMKSPVFFFQAIEKIEGVKTQKSASDVILAEHARKMGIHVLDKEVYQEKNRQDVLRAKYDTSDAKASDKMRDISLNPYDIKIISDVSGEISSLRYSEQLGKNIRDASFDIVLKAVWADTGETIVLLRCPEKFCPGVNNDFNDMPFELTSQLPRAYLNRLLVGDGHVSVFYQMILKKWIIEQDLGTYTQIRLLQANKKIVDAVIEKLKAVDGVHHVHLRSFDSKFYSVLELESNADYMALAGAVKKVLSGKYQLDSATRRRLTFEPQK